jgi:hypothetical protein
VAEKTNTRKRRAAPSTIVPAGPPDVGKVVAVDTKKVVENWSEYHLSDGTILRVRPLVFEIGRAVRKYNQAGEPIYVVKGSLMINATKVPTKLKIKIGRT